ncbi:MAG TPA: proline--tRNA ligase [Candidatus Omnitrophota bacterium]|nr:proline--tRNA ligase [Candidatus Omnitrophota bacterium]
MYWTKTLIPTLKESPQEAESLSHKLMLRAGLIRMLMSGSYMYLPLGLRILNNIQAIIRQEMRSTGAAELLLPALQPLELWQRTGRDETIGEVMIRFVDRRGRKVCLGPTHEEVITELIRTHVSSYKQLPVVVYQIQTKFRDEMRPRFGIVRACEFIMKDAYSFDRDQAGLEKNYRAMHEAYTRIFQRCGLDCLALEADSGVMGGKVSHEFMVPCESGEDAAFRCLACKKAVSFTEGNEPLCPACSTPMKKINVLEVGHIFQLGTKYTAALGAHFIDQAGKQQPIIMGCYGIGVSRLIAAIIEQNNDDSGIVWPKEVAPYQVEIVPLDVADSHLMQEATRIHDGLDAAGIGVLMDDRDERAGVKFKDAELIGVPLIVVLGKKNLEQGKIEVKTRADKKVTLVEKGEVAGFLKNSL